MATKEKINLLEVIPCRNEHIKAEQEGETIVLSFPRFKRSWMSRYLLPKGMSKRYSCASGRTRYGCMEPDRRAADGS